MSSWESLAAEYEALVRAPVSSGTTGALNRIVGSAAAMLPKDELSAVSWLTSALAHPTQKWFVAQVMTKVSPVPRALLDPLLTAALTERNLSSNRRFIDPCVRTFGPEAVTERLQALFPAVAPEYPEGLKGALYWVKAK